MPHNPIRQMINPGRLDRIEIKLNQMGVLYTHNRFKRLMKPGDGLTMDDRLQGGLSVYIVDCAPHTASWSVNLMAHDERDTFPVTINVKYRVKNAQRMVEEQISDTETMIARALEPLMRKESRQYRLNQYKLVEAKLEEIISAPTFATYGLDLMEVDVVPALSNADLERIKNLNDLERAMKVTQQSEHEVDLPSKDTTDKFHAHVIVNYKVIKVEDLPTTNLAEAEKWLWQRINVVLRRTGRQHNIAEIDQAEIKMQEAVEDETFEAHGLEVVSVQIELDLDERTRTRTQKLAEIRDERAIAEEQAKAEEIKHQRELDKQKRAIDFYAPYIKEGEWRLLAMSLANNEMDAKEVLATLNKQQREKLEIEMKQQQDNLNLKLKMLDVMMEKDGLSEKTAESLTDQLIFSVSNQLIGDENKQLQQPEEHKALESGSNKPEPPAEPPADEGAEESA